MSAEPLVTSTQECRARTAKLDCQVPLAKLRNNPAGRLCPMTPLPHRLPRTACRQFPQGGSNNLPVIRTGSGDIQIHAAGSGQLLNEFATMYTVGALGGGNVTLEAGHKSPNRPHVPPKCSQSSRWRSSVTVKPGLKSAIRWHRRQPGRCQRTPTQCCQPGPGGLVINSSP